MARRRNLVVAPRKDRWHQQPTPLLGGAAMAFAVLVVLASAAPARGPALTVIAAAAAAFALGLIDDFRHLAPTSKVVGQILVALILVYGGAQFEIAGSSPALPFLLTIFWVVGMMNAVNLIDNMDGLAAGVTAIAALALGLGALGSDSPMLLISAATAGAALGFLVHNFSPARVFMGDAGSLMLGLLLAAAALERTVRGATNVGIALVGPLAILALPIFDTALVAASRRLAGLPISRGGRDHASHRLAALGLSDRTAVLVLYVVAAVLAGLGLVADALSSFLPTLFGLSVVGLVLFGIFLSEVDVYERPDATARARDRASVVRKLALYVRFGAEVGLDLVLLTIAYYTSYLLRFEGLPDSAWIGLFIRSVPIVIGVQLATLVLVGVYRTLWRYLGVTDAVRIIRAISIGSATAALLILIVFRFDGYSRAVFALDWLIAAGLVIGARAFLLWLRQWFSSRPTPSSKRVLIVGANDSGALAVKLLNGSKDVSYHPVGFLDDDPGKRHRRVGGIPILGAVEDLERVAERHRVELVVLALDEAASPRAGQIRTRCQATGLECREFLIPV